MTKTHSLPAGFTKALIASGLWIMVLECIRAFLIVLPMTKAAFPDFAGIAPMNMPIFISWTVWMVLLIWLTAYSYWLHARVSGHNTRSVIVAGSFATAFSLLLFWIANVNMGTGTVTVALIAVPWAWVELVVACQITRVVLQREMAR